MNDFHFRILTLTFIGSLALTGGAVMSHFDPKADWGFLTFLGVVILGLTIYCILTAREEEPETPHSIAVTEDSQGNPVAVTAQDEEGRIIEVLWAKGDKE
jgi:hypothetical protein